MTRRFLRLLLLLTQGYKLSTLWKVPMFLDFCYHHQLSSASTPTTQFQSQLPGWIICEQLLSVQCLLLDIRTQIATSITDCRVIGDHALPSAFIRDWWSLCLFSICVQTAELVLSFQWPFIKLTIQEKEFKPGIVIGIFFGPPTSSQIKTRRLIINYECSALA